MTRRRWLAPLAVAITGTALATGAWFGQWPQHATPRWVDAPPELQALLWPEPRPLPAFALTTQHGTDFGPGQFRGQWSFVFFGFLRCPDVCPTTLSALRELRQLLLTSDPAAAGYRFVFVSVDPEHDRAEAIGPYLEYFDPNFVGLSGNRDALAPLLGALAVMAVEVEDAHGRRSIDHTSSVMLIAPDGRAIGALPPPHEPRQMHARFELLRNAWRR